MNNKYTCHSGGCPGADMAWETEGYKYGVHTISYSFHNHQQQGKNQKILTRDELEEGYFHARMADKTLKRNFDGIQYPYVKNLLARNWFQVKNAEAIFAVGYLHSNTIAEGGTGWAVQMAIDSDKPMYFYHQQKSKFAIPNKFSWHRYLPISGFERLDYIPKLTKNFAGIGTRDLTDDGMNAIIDVYKNTLMAK